jgi:hypothetical protein
MSTRTSTTAGLDKPHKAVAPVAGQGSKWKNARSISTEQTNKAKSVRTSGGVASTYFGNSRDCDGAKEK